MVKKIIATSLFMCVMVVAGANVAAAEEDAVVTSASVSEQLTLLEQLMKQVEELQAKLASLREQMDGVRENIRENLSQGMSGDDIERVQELLATDPSLYPEGLVTGYFGPLTSAALKRFQERNELNPTGMLDDETRTMLEEYLAENGGGSIPPGFLVAPGIQQKIETRLIEDCDSNGSGKASFCNKIKSKYQLGTDDENDDEAEDEMDDENDDHSYDQDKDRDRDRDHRDDDEADTADMMQAAEDAIAAADTAIAELADAIDAATGDTADAEAALTAAGAAYDDAQAAYDAGDYEAAEEYADDAVDTAEDATEDLTDD